MDVNVRKRRQKGEGRAQEERKRPRAEGKDYVRKSNVLVLAKLPPSEQVFIISNNNIIF